MTYVFGQPTSVRAYLDGEELSGDWDMAGATTAPPVVDDAPVWIGSSMGGSAGSSFRGSLDEVRIHRAALPAAELRARFATTLPTIAAAPAVAAAPDPNAGNDSAGGTPKGPNAGFPVVKAAQPADWSQIPAGTVQIELCEDWRPEKNVWPEAALAVTDRFSAPAFGFFRVPHRYVDTGVRGARPDPYLLKAYGRITLPAGRHRLLLRSRGAAALFVDDRRMALTPFPPPGTDDKPVKVQDTFLDLGGNFRFAPPGNRDAWVEFDSPGGEHRITLETIVGYVINARSRRRPELGETVAAWSPQGSSQWYLLAPGAEKLPYDDAGWTRYAAAEETRLAAIDTAARAARRAEHTAYWERRRRAAAAWLAATPETPVPALPAGFPALNPIDHFLADRIAKYRGEASAGARGGVDFWTRCNPSSRLAALNAIRAARRRGNCISIPASPRSRAGLPANLPSCPGSPTTASSYNASCRPILTNRCRPRARGLPDRKPSSWQPGSAGGPSGPSFRRYRRPSPRWPMTSPSCAA